jgi:hypothetical protein
MDIFERQVLLAINSNKQYQEEVSALVEQVFNEKKESMMQEFAKHPVTVELSNENSYNVSSTLGGYGNLFGFIGFNSGSDPIGPVEEKLRELVELIDVSFSSQASKVQIKFNAPDLDDFGDVAQYDGWREGGNWLKGIERGISGLQYFRTSLGQDEKGRSGLGIQMKGNVKSFAGGNSKFNNKKYMTSIINNFKSSLSKI